MDILSWEDTPMVFYSVEELELLENEDSKKGDFLTQAQLTQPKGPC